MKLSVHLFLTDILPEKRRLFHKIVKNRIIGNQPVSDVFSKMKNSGIKGIEVLLPSFTTEKDIKDLKEITQINKIKIYSVHQHLRFLTTTNLKEITILFEHAKFLNAEVIVLHMNSAKRQVHDLGYINTLHSLQEKYGIKIGFENMERHVGSMMHGRVWHENKFADLIKKNDFYITLDTCHMGQSGGDIVRFVNDNSERIVNIHLSDYKPHYLNSSFRPIRYKHMALGKGTLPIVDFLNILKSKRYKGLLTMEIETDLDGLLESAQIINNAS